MIAILRKLAFSAAVVSLAVAFDASPVFAKTGTYDACARPSKKASVRKKRRAPRKSASVRAVQEKLAYLGYYIGKVDGIDGPRTKAAVKNFQKEHGLVADGIVGPKTRKAIDEAYMLRMNPPPKFLTHDKVLPRDMELHQDYALPLKKGPQPLSSRFARIDVIEVVGSSGAPDGDGKAYEVHVNGETILMVDGQPSVIGMSKTYDLGNYDAIIFTTYNAKDILCKYQNKVLVLDNAGMKLLPIENCTRTYKAQVNYGSLYISFPEKDDKRVFGATWRLDGVRLEKM